VFLFCGEVQGADLGIKLRVGYATAVVVLDHIFRSRDAAIVHVGGRASDFAERGRLEGAMIFGAGGHGKTAFIAVRSIQAMPYCGTAHLRNSGLRAYVTSYAIAFHTEYAQA
jgi:hypothetical protein